MIDLGRATPIFGISLGLTPVGAYWHFDARLTFQDRCVLARYFRQHAAHYFPTEYGIWKGMKARCLYPATPGFEHYGGRGISVCDRWLESFWNFLDDMGTRPPGTSIHRIENDGDYEPGNCKWATAKEQASNRRRPD